jgi:hypothetical protein
MSCAVKILASMFLIPYGNYKFRPNRSLFKLDAGVGCVQTNSVRDAHGQTIGVLKCKSLTLLAV